MEDQNAVLLEKLATLLADDPDPGVRRNAATGLAAYAYRAEVDRREWGLRWNQALETGGILVGNTVKIEIEAQAVAQEG